MSLAQLCLQFCLIGWLGASHNNLTGSWRGCKLNDLGPSAHTLPYCQTWFLIQIYTKLYIKKWAKSKYMPIKQNFWSHLDAKFKRLKMKDAKFAWFHILACGPLAYFQEWIKINKKKVNTLFVINIEVLEGIINSI